MTKTFALPIWYKYWRIEAFFISFFFLFFLVHVVCVCGGGGGGVVSKDNDGCSFAKESYCNAYTILTTSAL